FSEVKSVSIFTDEVDIQPKKSDSFTLTEWLEDKSYRKDWDNVLRFDDQEDAKAASQAIQTAVNRVQGNPAQPAVAPANPPAPAEASDNQPSAERGTSVPVQSSNT